MCNETNVHVFGLCDEAPHGSTHTTTGRPDKHRKIEAIKTLLGVLTTAPPCCLIAGLSLKWWFCVCCLRSLETGKTKFWCELSYDGQGKTKRQLLQFCLNYITAKSKRMNMYYTSDVHSSILTDYIWKSISKCCWYMVMNRCPQNIFHVQRHIKRFLTKQHFIY